MRSAISTSLALVILVTSLPARAQEDPCASLRAEVPADLEPTRLEHGGVAGMWFPMPTARLVLCEVRELRLRRASSALDARELSLWEARVELGQERLQLAVDARDELESVLEASERRARSAEEALNDWTRSPVLWFAVGVVAAVLVAGAGALLLAEISP